MTKYEADSNHETTPALNRPTCPVAAPSRRIKGTRIKGTRYLISVTEPMRHGCSTARFTRVVAPGVAVTGDNGIVSHQFRTVRA